MGKFHYCSSEDELAWYMDPNYGKYIRMTSNQLYANRFNIRQWIENTCISDVAVWNEVSTPMTGDAHWERKITPQGSAQFYFSDEKDATLFILRWIQN